MNRVTKLLGIKYPIISAAMSWVTSAKFVAAVSNAGGMGVLGPNAGQNNSARSLEEFVESVRSEIRKVRELTDRPFAVNYILPFDANGTSSFTNALFDVLVEENVNIVVVIGVIMHRNEIEKLKKHGFTVIYRPINPTVQNLIEAETAGVDALIVTGNEAGGHISQYEISLFTLVPQATDSLKIPVIAAGGVIDGRGVKAVMDLGAEGVYMGTRFVATHENPASDAAKQVILQVTSDEFLRLEGANERTIPTIGGKRAFQLIKEGKLDEAGTYIKNGFKTGILDGNLEVGTISISPSAGGIKEIKTCKQVIDEIVNVIS